MKKNLLGLLIIALAIGLTACSQEGYVKLAEKMGKMSENVYGIEANMSDVHNATGTVDSTVEITVGEDGKTSAVLKLDNAAQIMADVAKVKNSGQKTEALKTALSEPVVDPNDENAATGGAASSAACCTVSSTVSVT